MGPILVYSKNGDRKLLLNSQANKRYITRAECDTRCMENDTITIEVECAEVLPIIIGDYIIYRNNRYKVNQAPRIDKVAKDVLVYQIVFESAKYDLANVVMLMPENTIGYMLTGNLQMFAEVILENINRVYHNEWFLGEVPGDTDTKTEQFEEQNCLAALQRICELYEYEFRITELDNIKTIDIIKKGANSNLKFKYGAGRGLYTLTRDSVADEDVVTRLYVYGSTDNLNTGYRHDRLCLPNKTKTLSYIQDASKIALYGLKEGLYIDDEIKPHSKAYVTEVFTPATADNVKKFKSAEFSYDLKAKWILGDYAEYLQVRGYEDSIEVYNYFVNHIIGTYKYLLDKAKLTFNSGNLTGYSFDIHDYDDITKTFELVTIIENEGTDDEQKIPDETKETYQINVGDEFIITDISLPYALVEEAERELLQKGREYYEEHSNICAQYSLELDPLYIERYYPDGIDLLVGDYIKIEDVDLDVDKYIKVERILQDIINGTYTIEISDIKKTPLTPRRFDNNPGGVVDSEVVMPITSLNCTFIPNYNGDANRVHISAGEFATNMFGNFSSWRVFEREIENLIPTSAYDIYVRAYRRQNYQYADIVFMPILRPIGTTASSLPIADYQPPQSDDYYYLKIGYLSPVLSRGLISTRQMSLQYGYVQISGRDLNGGVITNEAGETVINLDRGIIQGDILYKQGNKYLSVSELSTKVDDVKNINDKLEGNIKDLNVRMDKVDSKVENVFYQKDYDLTDAQLDKDITSDGGLNYDHNNGMYELHAGVMTIAVPNEGRYSVSIHIAKWEQEGEITIEDVTYTINENILTEIDASKSITIRATIPIWIASISIIQKIGVSVIKKMSQLENDLNLVTADVDSGETILVINIPNQKL